jgi:hypothetical protein
MKSRLLLVGILFFCLASCKKKTSNSFPFNGKVIAYAPVPVTKSVTKRVFAHFMPWFETPATNTLTPDAWGEHWTMTNQDPNNFNSSGQREIASHYYPLIGPYASSDTTVIDYQLLLMKLSGIDGIMIDWSGVGDDNGVNPDFPMIKRNTDIVVSRLGKVGLKYAIVYEDQAVKYIIDYVDSAKVDMAYLQNNYFTDPNYELIGGAPLLLNFGPQKITTGTEWDSVFSALPIQPAFFPLWGFSNNATGVTTGEFAWINPDNLTSLTKFYNGTYTSYNPPVKISSAYAGFNTFYAQGGESGPTWTINANGTTNFQQTLALAIAQNNNYIQLPTWNDYGEGTMIEPTTQFNYSLLTTLQQELGVSSTLSQSDLQAVAQLYQLRKANAGNAGALAKLDQGFYFMASLQMDSAKALLNSF